MSEIQAVEVPASAGLTAQQQEAIEYEAVDRLFAGRPPAVKFTEPGDSVVGYVIRAYTREKTKFGTDEPDLWPDGSPKLEPVIDLLVGDDDKRTLFVGSWRMQNALGEAFAAAGVRGPRRGGRLLVRYTGNEPGRAGTAPAKVYEAGYELPGGVQAGSAAPAVAGTPAGQADEVPF
jgi:hypothetical protein